MGDVKSPPSTASAQRMAGPGRIWAFSYGLTPLIQPSPVDDSPRRYTSSNEEALQLCQPFRHQVCIIVAYGFRTTIF